MKWLDNRGSARISKGLLFRGLALLCACSLSIGSHFGQNTLGPLKSRLNREKATSNTEFSLLIAAFGLNSTWTPLVGGLLVARLGTARSSIFATTLIFAGQVILLLGELADSVVSMLLGMFIFGLGISPLAVVQETIIVRFFNEHGLGVSLALGLVAGKGASFVSARISFPLSEWNPHAPFFVSTLLAAISFSVNLFYLSASKWIARGAGVGLESAEAQQENVRMSQSRSAPGEQMSEAEALQKVVDKRTVRVNDLARMGDVFWLYMAINVLCGTIWAPFTHLASNAIEIRYDLTEGKAAEQASLLLAGSIVLYPVCGYITDTAKKKNIVHRLLLLSSFLTLLCYGWLALPPWITQTALPAMISFGAGHGFSPLLLVLIVPQLVPLKYVSTALGAHKSIESSGSTIMQTIAGLVLDVKSKKGQGAELAAGSAIQTLLNTFVFLNIAQLLGVLCLSRSTSGDQRRVSPSRTSSSTEYQPLAESEESEDMELSQSASESDADRSGYFLPNREDGTRHEDDRSSARRNSDHEDNESSLHHKRLPHRYPEDELRPSNAEHFRGRLFFIMAVATVIFAWLLFMTSAVLDLRSRRARTDPS